MSGLDGQGWPTPPADGECDCAATGPGEGCPACEMKYKTWECKIVVPMDAKLPEGFDSPPRWAAMGAVARAGVPVLACFSGWGGELTATQQECVDKDIARRSNAEA